MTNNQIRPLTLLAAVLLVSACATPIQTVEFDRDAAGTADEIRILPMQATELRSQIFSNPVRVMGLVGNTLASATDASRQRALRERMGEIAINEYFAQALEAELLAREYSIMWLAEYPGERDGYGLHESYTGAGADNALQLDIALQFVGYAADGVGETKPYYPTVSANVRVVDATGGAVLFQNSFNYHGVLAGEESVVIEPDEEYGYPSFHDLRDEEPEVLVRALNAALDAVAAEIAAQF